MNINERIVQEVTAIYDGKICGKNEKDLCREKYVQYLAWTCSKCSQSTGKVDEKKIMPLTHHLLRLRRIVRGGPALGLDDFDLLTWERLGIISDVIEAIQRKQTAMLMLPRSMGL